MITYSDDNEILLSCTKDIEGKIVIPNGVKTIASHAFKNCYDISEIVLPDTISQIQSQAFEGCTSLEEINIPKEVKEIPYECFSGCVNLHTISLPSQIIEIASGAFNNCQSLTTILLPNSIRNLGYEAFKNCCNLCKILIPNGISSISSGTFSGCESLSEIKIPQNIRSINPNAFEGCNELRCVIIESKDIDIDPTAFIGCEHLTRIYLGNFTPIRVLSAFPDCANIKYIAPLEDFSKGLSKEAVSLNFIQAKLSNELKYMSLYYRLFNMNITQMKWSECPKRNNKSFKEPIDTDWETYKIIPQSLDYILKLNWEKSAGIGLVLGYNQYRALDVDISSLWVSEIMYPDEGLNGFINEILTLLHLPIDYPWVVRSGNGCGFHIIFKSEDNTATQNIDSLSFEPKDEYCDSDCKLFYRMELRWCDHLVLPPSLHASGLQYRFRNGTLPTIIPSKVTLTELDSMIDKYCGERIYFTANYKDITIELTEINKIKSRHDSYLSPHEHQINTIAWLIETSSPESKNSLALRYLFGKEIASNSDLAIKYLTDSDSQSAKFNLLQLYACGFIKYNAEIYNKLQKTLDENLFNEHLDILQSNADKYLPVIDRYLFFDTETTGLPQNYNAPSSDIKNWPRLIQLSWIITDQFQNILAKHNHIIKPNGFVIPNESMSVHGISTEYAKINGENLDEVLDLFESDIKSAKYIIGHNIDFDKKIIEAEFYRENKVLSWKGTISLCTMKSAIDFCKLRNFYGYRYPKLQELYNKLFGTDFENAHNAFSDISATVKCFWEMVKRGIITIPQTKAETATNTDEDDLPF